MVEIDCPPDCVYLSEGLRYQVEQKYARLSRAWNEHQRQEIARLSDKFGDLVHSIESYLARNRRALGSDGHVLEALELIEKSLETELKGIIYRPSASSLIAETAAKEIETILEKRRSQPDLTLPRLSNSEALSIIRILKEDVSYHIRSGTRYLDFVARSHPERREPSRLILP
ncbi:MAG: hypothetical protein HY644_09605 [Acidobacteria bacterium]|nr:hypothetical protein [Acidobacteriota bacterium]